MGLITKYAQYQIWIGLVWPIPDSAENDRIGADTDTKYRIDASLILSHSSLQILSKSWEEPSAPSTDFLWD